ncbi:hypothetical protein AB6A40_002067 [Gnathostoma spinigerum]|uniref:Uncharacterized protein n=1 Tax=Gnathostoma spinigerum TaxID=75299 RepID=A0ABD6EEQ2_9BILA
MFPVKYKRKLMRKSLDASWL